MEGNIRQVLDTRGALRCVRFESGNVGVVTTRGKAKLVVGPFQQLSFADNGFLRVFSQTSSKRNETNSLGLSRAGNEDGEANGREFFIDMKNGELYAHMPEFIRFGDFEITSIGGYLCTRTKKLYEVKAIPAEAWHGKQGLHLALPYRGEPEDSIRKKMIWTPQQYVVCLLNGDDSGVYWRMRVFEDHSLLVMDDDGNYYHAKKSARSRKAVKKHLGQAKNEADWAVLAHGVREIEEQVAASLKRKAAKARREAEKERKQQMAMLVASVPFAIGNKWGLRHKGRMVVPPIYRRVESPIGHYCAVETYPGIWGVMAVDGKMEIEPRYEDVMIHTDGTVDLTVRPGKVITRKLP